MKRAGEAKFASAPTAPQSSSGATGPAECSSCGWQFKRDNTKRFLLDPKQPHGRWHTRPRTQINTGRDTLCADCYERMLWEKEQHSRQGIPVVSALYEQSLFPERHSADAEAAKAAKESLRKQVSTLLGKMGMPV